MRSGKKGVKRSERKEEEDKSLHLCLVAHSPSTSLWILPVVLCPELLLVRSIQLLIQLIWFAAPPCTCARSTQRCQQPTDSEVLSKRRSLQSHRKSTKPKFQKPIRRPRGRRVGSSFGEPLMRNFTNREPRIVD